MHLRSHPMPSRNPHGNRWEEEAVRDNVTSQAIGVRVLFFLRKMGIGCNAKHVVACEMFSRLYKNGK